MGLLISSSDFTGKYALPQTVFSDLDSFINDPEGEQKYLTELLGASLFADFKNNLAGTPKVPTAQNYLNIYNAFSIDYDCDVLISTGLIDMLKGLIFFDYMADVKYKATTQGIVINSPDTSTLADYGKLYTFHNNAIHTYQAIQIYIQFINRADYTAIKFNGQPKGIVISMLQ